MKVASPAARVLMAVAIDVKGAAASGNAGPSQVRSFYNYDRNCVGALLSRAKLRYTRVLEESAASWSGWLTLFLVSFDIVLLMMLLRHRRTES